MNMQEDKSIIEVSHVSKYFGDKTALDDVTLNVKYNRQIKKFPTEKQNVSLKHILT